MSDGENPWWRAPHAWQSSARKKRLLRGFLLIVSVLSLGYFLVLLHEVTLDGMKVWPARFSLGWFSTAVVFGVIQMGGMAWFYGWLLTGQTSIRISSTMMASQIAKYLPGKIWVIVMQRALAGGDVTTAGVIGVTAILMLTLVTGHLAVLAFILVNHWWGLPAALAVLAVILASTYVVCALARKLAHLFRNGANLVLQRSRLAVITCGVTGYIFASSIAAWGALYWGALGYPWDVALALQGVSSGSFIVGLASALPAGLGVREMAFIWFGALDLPLPKGDMPVLAVVSRAWLFTVDAMAVATGLCAYAAARRRRP